MDEARILDALFAVIAVLLIPIGYRRGVVREVFSTAAIFTGVALAGSWGRPWGNDLAELTDVDLETGQFAVSVAFLIVALLLLGYGGAFAAVGGVPRRWAKVAGAALAVINGALIGAQILEYIDRLLADEGTRRTLAESEVSRVLMDELGWVLVGGAGVALAMIVLSALFGRETRELRAAPATASHYTGDRRRAQEQQRGPRLRWGRDDGKVEPVERGFDPVAGRYAADAPHYSETMPISTVTRGSFSTRGAPPATGNEWISVGPAQPSFTPAAPAQSAEGDLVRCASCGERLAAGDAFCPRCGRART